MINPKGSNVRLARKILENLIRNSKPPLSTELMCVWRLLHRAKPVRHAGVKHRGWSDPTLKQDILTCIARHPDWSRQEVATFCNTNTGRVSEADARLV